MVQVILAIIGIIVTLPGEYGFPWIFSVQGLSIKDSVGGWMFFGTMIAPVFVSIAYLRNYFYHKRRGWLWGVGVFFIWYATIILSFQLFAHLNLAIWIGVLSYECARRILSYRSMLN